MGILFLLTEERLSHSFCIIVWIRHKNQVEIGNLEENKAVFVCFKKVFRLSHRNHIYQYISFGYLQTLKQEISNVKQGSHLKYLSCRLHFLIVQCVVG